MKYQTFVCLCPFSFLSAVDISGESWVGTSCPSLRLLARRKAVTLEPGDVARGAESVQAAWDSEPAWVLLFLVIPRFSPVFLRARVNMAYGPGNGSLLVCQMLWQTGLGRLGRLTAITAWAS